MKRFLFFLSIISVLLCGAGYAREVSFDIIALVNEDAITRRDLNNRLEIALSATKLPDTAETRTKLTPQLLQVMIDESLQRQEANRLELAVTETEMGRAKADLEKQNNVAEGQLSEYVKKQGLDKDAVLRQVETQILWTKVIYKKVRPFIKISDQEIKDTIEKVKLQVGAGASELELAEIVLPVAAADEEQNVKQLAAKLYEEIRNGADFGSVAKEFSTSSTSDKKGVIGWFMLDDLEPTLKQALDGVELGGITLPVRSPRGYVLIKVLNKKQSAEASAQAGATPDEARVREVLTLRKMELEARRYLSTLRDKAYVEKRL